MPADHARVAATLSAESNRPKQRAPAPAARAHVVTLLQHSAGNRAVAGWLQGDRQARPAGVWPQRWSEACGPANDDSTVDVQRQPTRTPIRSGGGQYDVTSVGEVGLVDNDGHSDAETRGPVQGREPGVQLRPVPSEAGNTPVGRLPHNQQLFIRSVTPHGWYDVVATDGRTGWISKAFVRRQDEMPDPGSRLHRIQADESAFDIVAGYYGSTSFVAGSDARFYSNVLVYANDERNRKGIRRPTRSEALHIIRKYGWSTYLGAWTEAGKQIWIPSKEFAGTLKGHVSAGSLSRDVWEKAKSFGAKALEQVVKVPAFVAGLLVGVAESLWDMVKGVVDLVKSIVTGSIVQDVKALLSLITDKDLRQQFLEALADDLTAKWENANPLTKWYWRGWIIGYVVGEILGMALTAAAGTAVKASKFGTKLATLVRSLKPVQAAMAAAAKVAGSRPARAVGPIVGALKAVQVGARILQLRHWAATALKLPGVVIMNVTRAGLLALEKLTPKAQKALRRLVEMGEEGFQAIRDLLGCRSTCRFGPDDVARVEAQLVSGTPHQAVATATFYERMTLPRLRRLAVSDKNAAEALVDRYWKLPDRRLRALSKDGDAVAQRILDQRIPSNEAALERALGSNYRPPHDATVDVLRRTPGGGRLPDPPQRFTSGNMTPAEEALGWPANMLATHTEARAVNRIALGRGDKMRIWGTYDPCASCRQYMQRAASRSGATIVYHWIGGTQVFRP